MNNSDKNLEQFQSLLASYNQIHICELLGRYYKKCIC